MDLHDLILIVAAYVAGIVTDKLLHIWADHRAKPYIDGWQKADEIARKCQLNEAFRVGQEQAHQCVIEAPAPQQWY